MSAIALSTPDPSQNPQHLAGIVERILREPMGRTAYVRDDSAGVFRLSLEAEDTCEVGDRIVASGQVRGIHHGVAVFVPSQPLNQDPAGLRLAKLATSGRFTVHGSDAPILGAISLADKSRGPARITAVNAVRSPIRITTPARNDKGYAWLAHLLAPLGPDRMVAVIEAAPRTTYEERSAKLREILPAWMNRRPDREPLIEHLSRAEPVCTTWPAPPSQGKQTKYHLIVPAPDNGIPLRDFYDFTGFSSADIVPSTLPDAKTSRRFAKAHEFAHILAPDYLGLPDQTQSNTVEAFCDYYAIVSVAAAWPDHDTRKSLQIIADWRGVALLSEEPQLIHATGAACAAAMASISAARDAPPDQRSIAADAAKIAISNGLKPTVIDRIAKARHELSASVNAHPQDRTDGRLLHAAEIGIREHRDPVVRAVLSFALDASKRTALWNSDTQDLARYHYRNALSDLKQETEDPSRNIHRVDLNRDLEAYAARRPGSPDSRTAIEAFRTEFDRPYQHTPEAARQPRLEASPLHMTYIRPATSGETACAATL